MNVRAMRSVVDHVFMPPNLPRVGPEEWRERIANVALCDSLIEAARDFLKILPSSESSLWIHMIKMMELSRRAANATLKEDDLQPVLSGMALGGVFCMHIRAQNAALIVRRLFTADFVQFEVFEVLPLMSAVMEAEGKLLCSYPGLAIKIPADIFTDEGFLGKLSSFLVGMDFDRFYYTQIAPKEISIAHESLHPRNFSALLVGILRGCGHPAFVDPITKRIGDEVLADTPDKGRRDKSWRRSPLWLILRVTLQSSLRSNNLYKPFILFFHAHLLRCGVRQNFPSELLYIMRTKMARRLSKLGPDVSHNVHQFVHDSARETETLLSKRWTTFQKIESTHSTLQLKDLDFVADSNISFVKSYEYLADVLLSASQGPKHKRFTPSYGPRLCNEHDFVQFTNGALENAIAKDPHIALADFELSVGMHLESWVAASTNNVKSLDVIASCIQQYISGAKALYKDNPEDNSIMILTIMDLWVALDWFAIQACPLLKQYTPEIPSNFLHCLLLHRSAALKRALHIEEYLCQRHKEALEATSIFSNRVDDSSFALKYFRTSKNLQHLYDEINTHSLRRQAAKRAQLGSLNNTSRSNLRKASKMDHEPSEDKFGRGTHSASCKKCELECRAKALKISVHEWLLPPSTILAQLVVFELSPPHAFSIWRDITYMILRDIGLPRQRTLSPNEPTSGDVLDSFSPLRRWAAKRRPNLRVTVCSIKKPSSTNMVAIPAEEPSIFLDNEPSFMLFDLKYRSWVMGSPLSWSSVAELCNPPIPTSSPYRRTHQFVCSTQHTPNDIIATQADCPHEINLHGFISFSGLRSGPRLQWLNIARELASPYLSFSHEEVHTLITQAAWQLGPLSDGIREWHADLSIFSFGNVLLHELETLLEKTKANWREEVTVRTIALICSRLLVSSTDVDVSRRACLLLRDVRTVTYRWIGEVRMNIGSTSDETSQTRLQNRLWMLAATCFSTFDVCPEHVPTAIVNEEDISIAVQCAVIAHDIKPQFPSGDSSLYFSRMLRRHHRLLHDLEPLFSQPSRTVGERATLLHAGALNHALERVWLGYHQGNSLDWHVLHKQNPRWVLCVTNKGQEVHYDLLSGELLIGGKSSGRLPQGIVEDPTYKSIFGARIFDVVPADIPGMDYMTRSTLFGYQILFSWNCGNIILQIRKLDNSQLLQLIPRSTLVDDFPRHFVEEYIHWLDLSTGELEFRPISSPWTPRPSNWCLNLQKLSVLDKPKRIALSRYALLQKACQGIPPIRLIDIRSSTFDVVSRLLSPIENPGYLIITHTTQTLEVSLPRLRLSFFINTNWELECRSMPGYVVDKTQSYGTMFGLRNKLILCPGSTIPDEPLMQRRVIIPQGQISFSRSENFTKVYMNTGLEEHVRWQEYTIDTVFGCLRGNTSLMSKLYQCYLHALTSHCLPDPLLGHTGTEEALYILRSSSCRSFQRLDAEEAKMLELIGDMTPRRDRLLENIAQVTWKDLPALSQHHDFYPAVRSLFDHATALETLYDKPTNFGIYRDPLLLNRAASRNRSYYPSDLHIPGQPSFRGDVEYWSRIVSNLGTTEHAAFQTSRSIWNGQLSPNGGSPGLWDEVVIPAFTPYVVSPQFITSTPKAPSYSLCDILSARGNVPTPPAGGGSFPTTATDRVPPSTPGSHDLQTLIDELQNSQQSLLQLCGSELSRSNRALVEQSASQFVRHGTPPHGVLLVFHDECSHTKDKIFSEIEAALAPSQKAEEIIGTAGLWPRITLRSILRQLDRDHFTTLPNQWKPVIMGYALSLLKYQQSTRLLELSSRQNHEELLREIEAVSDEGMKEWTPDWLLIQVEGNFMARPVQVAVAREMISPSSKRNISLQLNMGEGKSSIILPLVTSTLANGLDLVRVVTLKPLSNQMFQLFVNQLSGLANRPIFYVPISRRLRVDTSLVRTIKGLFEQCVAKGGVLIIQPEHILSLKLLHIDTLLKLHRNSEGRSTANELGALRDWLARVSRDVLDESDEILHVRYQLIYTAGEQMLLDDHPNRWSTIQQVFSRLKKLAVNLHANFPMMFGIDATLRGFPIIHILDSAIFQRISSHIINDALAGGLPNLPLGTLPPPIREAARRFMARREVSDVDHELVHQYCTGTTLFNGILLLRGLLVEDEGVLCYVLRERRWKVDYGLDPSRTLLAVPYRAKDVPSQKAEFAHPDVAIALTCLSYYYGGLTKDQVLLCFDLLAKLGNPEMEYEHWVELGQETPVGLRQLNGVNLEDETQVNEFIVPSFSRNKGAVDFYLSQVVFPQAAREFPWKLPTSAWDLVEEKTNVTTGFSGTNDNRYLLPTSITQENPDFVLGTNALVLRNLLRPENDHYECMEGDKGKRESATAFLKRLVKKDPEIRVLLDVGAQMLELQNKELAQQWLSLRPDVAAAIFFNNSDHLTVVTQDGTMEPLISSPFNRQLEKCFVYLDDAHTRGTDLKLPRGMRAAITLGPKVTKDRLVQGCMRMRQLGHGHSVMFFAPTEVDHHIRRLIPSGMTSGGCIRVLDVVRWAIHESCEDIGHRLPYWAQQGLDHCKRSAAYDEYRSTGNSEVLRSTWLQPDSQTLEEMYGNTPVAGMSSEINSTPALCERIKWLGCTRLVNVKMAEEQEREVNHEVQPGYSTGRKHRRPPRVLGQPADHIIHVDIREFIETGKLPQSSTHISPLLAPIDRAGALDLATEWSPSPFATADFTTTILGSGGVRLTEYLRPVNWILSSGSGKNSIIVVISPYEANTLLPVIRESNKVRLHIYTPRVISSMRSFSDLTFYSISNSPAIPSSAPAHIRTLLNLFAGQLYFDSTKEYERACVLLALSMAHPGATYIHRDGFVPPEHRTGKDSPFARSMVPILKKLIGLRRKGMDYSRTHLGQILNGKPLSDEALWDMSA